MHIVTQSIITLMFLLITGSFLVFIYQTDSLKALNNQQQLKKFMTMIFCSFQTFLQIPIIELICSSFFLKYGSQNQQYRVLILFLSCLNSVFFLLMTLFLNKLFIIRIPCQTIPWSASNTQLHFMKVINKILLVVTHLQASSYDSGLLILQIIAFLLFLGTSMVRILIIPYYSILVNWFTRITELLSAALMVLVLVASTMGQNFRLLIIISILIIPGFITLAVLIDQFRQQQLIRKLENNQIRLEIEYEYVLYLLINQTQRAMGWDDQSAYALSNILYLVDIHNRTCINYQCPCQMREIIQYLLNKGFNQKLNIIDLEEEEINLLNSAGTDVFIQSDKNSQSSKTFTLFQVYNFYQDYLDNKQQMNEDSLKKQSIQINLTQLKQAFLNRFIENYFDEARKRMPYSKRLFFQYAYFTLYQCKNSFLTETLLRNFGNQKANWIEKVSIKVNELQAVMEIRKASLDTSNNPNQEQEQLNATQWGIAYEQDVKMNYGSKSYATDKFDPENFILMTLLTNKYYNSIEKLTVNIQNFWKQIQSDSLEVFKAYLKGQKVARTISKIYDIFDEIEIEKKQLDFRLYFVFALIQKFLLNDLIAHDVYINKMNSFRDMNKLIKSTLNLAKIEDTGCMLVHGQDKLFGKIILSNQVLRKWLNYSQKDLKHANIKMFMPNLINGWHQEFVADFNRTGINGVLNRNTCMFVLKKNGYVIPVMINIRFHYSKDYEFTFICFMTFMSEIQVQKNASRHRIDEILFFICDDVDGRIYEISESCNRQLGFNVQHILSNDLNTQISTHITISDICPTLNFRKIKELRNQAESLMTIEEIVELDLNIIKSLTSTSNIHNQKLQKALCQVFQESYGSRKDKIINIVTIILLDQIEMKRYIQQKQTMKRKGIREQANGNMLQMAEDNLQKQDNKANSSIPGSSISSIKDQRSSSMSTDSRTGTSQTEILKQLYSSTEKKTPKSLRIITQLIIVVALIMIVISSINLILALDRNANLVTEVNTVRKSYDRIAYHAKTRLLLRGMINMANGYEPLTSEITQQRFTAYQIELEAQIESLKDVQDYLEKVSFDYSQDFRNLVDSEVVEMQFLDSDNNIYSKMKTHSFANNLYIQRISEVQAWNMSRLQGNISILQLKPTPKTYKPTDEERVLFFLIQNAQDQLRNYDQIFSNYYMVETIQHALDTTYKTQITIIVSIASIVIVSLIVSPMICRIEERKFIGLKFFLYVEHSHIAQMLQNCEHFLRLAFSDSSVHTGNTQQEMNIVENKKALQKLNKMNNFYDSDQLNHDSGFLRSQEVSSSEDNSNAGHKLYRRQSDIKEYASMYSYEQNNNPQSQINQANEQLSQIVSYLENEGQKVSNQHQKFGNKISENDDSNVENQENFQNHRRTIQENDVTIQVSQLEVSQHTLVMKDPNDQIQNLGQKSQHQKALSEIKFQKIRQIIYRQKSKTILAIAILALGISSYYIACYFLAEKSFSQTPEIIKYLDLVFYKDACLENSIAFVRENQIRNITVPLIESQTQSAAEYFINDCMQREEQYTQMRKNVPAVFTEIKSYMETLETDQLCSITYEDNAEKLALCKKVYHNLLKNGLSYSINQMLTYYQRMYLKFDINPRLRTYSYLLAQNIDEDSVRLAELKDFVLDKVFMDFKDKVTVSTTNYYAKLISQYTILYGIFVVVITFLLVYFFAFAYQNIKDTMWRTNLTLKIMPMDFIPKECLPDLKKFFSS